MPRSDMGIWVGTVILGRTVNRTNKSQGMFEGYMLKRKRTIRIGQR